MKVREISDRLEDILIELSACRKVWDSVVNKVGQLREDIHGGEVAKGE